MKKLELSNKESAKSDQDFIKLCQQAGIQPTARQFSKYKNKHGLIYNLRFKTSVDSSND